MIKQGEITANQRQKSESAMKTKENLTRRLWRTMNDSRLEKPLMITAILLAMVLAGLLLLPVLRDLAGTAERTRTADPPQAETAVLPETEAIQQFEEPPLENMPAEVTIVEEPAEEGFGWRQVGDKTCYLLEDGSFAVGLHEIDGKLCYFDQNGVKARSLGVDVSYYDNTVDWQAMKAQGIDFAIIRVGGRGWSSGLLYDDCRTGQYLRGARDAGLRIGVYFYSTAKNPGEAAEEAAAALMAVDGLPLELPIFIDMEFSGEYPNGRADQLSPSERAAIATAFCETIRNGGYLPGVYAGQNFLKAYIDYFSVSRYTVWLASYTADNKLPFFNKRYDIWQFTDQGKVDGIVGFVDLNVIFDA